MAACVACMPLVIVSAMPSHFQTMLCFIVCCLSASLAQAIWTLRGFRHAKVVRLREFVSELARCYFLGSGPRATSVQPQEFNSACIAGLNTHGRDKDD